MTPTRNEIIARLRDLGIQACILAADQLEADAAAIGRMNIEHAEALQRINSILDQTQRQRDKLCKENSALAAWQCAFTDGKTGLVAHENGSTYCNMSRRVDRLMPWAKLGMALMEAWPPGGDVDGFEIHDMAVKAGVLIEIEGGFDPDLHTDTEGCAEPGDPWFQIISHVQVEVKE